MKVETHQDTDGVQNGLDLSIFDGINTGKVLADLDVRLEHDLDKDLRQREVVELMLREDQPVFSVYKLRQLLDANVSEKTVRRRLDELVELNVVRRYQLNGNNLYYINDRRSGHAVPGDLHDIDLPDNPSFLDMFLLRKPGTLNWMFNSSMMMALYLFLFGTINEALGEPLVVSSQNAFFTSGMTVMLSILFIAMTKSLSLSVLRSVGKLQE